jgi:hypothetical protein
MPSKKKSNAATPTSTSSTTSSTAAAYGALVVRAVVVVALAAWAAWSVEPLLHDRHAVPRHDHQPSPQHIRNAQGLWLHHYAWLPPASSTASLRYEPTASGDYLLP